MKKVLYPSRIKDSNLGDVLINSLLIRELSKKATVYLDGDVPSMANIIFSDNPHKENIRIVRGLVRKFSG